MSRTIIEYFPPDGLTSKKAEQDGVITVDGVEYFGTRYYQDRYSVNNKWILDAKEDGLPHIQFGHGAYICERDFHEYCAGHIGGTTHGYPKYNKNKKEEET